jgi:NAD(P)-dependent dehydrogenase (short-subunit alcohol dehydrogenase family)
MEARMKTVLITGTSSGFGKTTAQLFLDNGWNVVATMRRGPAGHVDSHGSEAK